jgi:hypothetical protein
MSTGKAAFDQVEHPVSRFLVSSRFMRNFYGAIKGIAFAWITAAWGFISLEHTWSGWVHIVGLILSWITITITILRGLPVIVEGYNLLKEPPAAK